MHSARRRHDMEEQLHRREIAQGGATIEVIHASQGESPAGRTHARVMPSAEHPARERIEAALRMGGYASYGGDWQCPACRCRVTDEASERHSDLSLRLEIDGESVRLRCEHGCRENTIRAMLGMAAYVEDPAPPDGRRGSRH